jgi:hypothetical protein
MRRQVATNRRRFFVGLAAVLAFPVAAGADDTATKQPQDAASLAFEEAELRERLMTALAVADGVRTQGRTLYVAMAETERLLQVLTRLDPADPGHREYTARLGELVRRQEAMAEGLDQDFAVYVGIVEDLARTIRPRLQRIGEALATRLADLGLTRLQTLQPLLQQHVEELNRSRVLTATIRERWLAEIDDSRVQRDERFRRERPSTEVPRHKGEKDI